MNDINSLRLELEAERHAHRKDNEYLLSKIEQLQSSKSDVLQRMEWKDDLIDRLNDEITNKIAEIERLRAELMVLEGRI